MRARNGRTGYGSVAIALHWLAALAVTLMLGSALPMYLHLADPTRRLPYLHLHASIGAAFAALLLARAAWHFIDRQPKLLSPSRGLRQLAGGVHVVLLLLIVAQLATGPLAIWSGGGALRVFGLIVLPSPFGGAGVAWHDAIAGVHIWSGAAIALLVALHLAGVAKHFLIDDDDTLARMIGLAGRDA